MNRKSEIIQVQLELVQGYYNKIILDNLSKEDILKTLEKDKEFLQQEQNVIDANKQLYSPIEPDTPLQPVKDEGAMAWLKREGYPDVMPMTLDNLGIILDRYTKYLSSPPEPSSKEHLLNKIIEWTDFLGKMGWYQEPDGTWHRDDETGYFKDTRSLVLHYNEEFDSISKEQEGDAVGFAEWIHKNYQIVFYLNREWKWCDDHVANYGGKEDDYFTTEQLYQLYKKKP